MLKLIKCLRNKTGFLVDFQYLKYLVFITIIIHKVKIYNLFVKIVLNDLFLFQ